VAKLNDLSPDMVEDQGFLDTMRDLTCDSNPTVVANAVATLSEISETVGHNVLEVNTSVLQKLLAALNECTEWGQVLYCFFFLEGGDFPPFTFFMFCTDFHFGFSVTL
jgi:AP-1 complex subunit beta-1